MFCSFPHRHGETTDMLEHQNEHFLRDFLKNSHFVASKSTFSYEFFLRTWKFATSKSMFRARLRSSFSASHRMPRLPRNLHLVTTSRSPDNEIRTKRWWSPKCCACHEKCSASSENVARVLRLPQKNDFVTFWNMSECHKVPRLPRETKLRDVWNPQKWPLLRKSPQARPYGPRTNGCGRLRNVERTHPQPPDPQSENGNPCYTYSGKIHCHWIHQPEQLGHLGLISHHDHSLVGKLIQSIHMISQYATIFVGEITFMVKYPHLLQKKSSIFMVESPLLQKLLDKITIFCQAKSCTGKITIVCCLNHHVRPVSSTVTGCVPAVVTQSTAPWAVARSTASAPSNIGATEDTWWNRAK